MPSQREVFRNLAAKLIEQQRQALTYRRAFVDLVRALVARDLPHKRPDWTTPLDLEVGRIDRLEADLAKLETAFWEAGIRSDR